MFILEAHAAASQGYAFEAHVAASQGYAFEGLGADSSRLARLLLVYLVQVNGVGAQQVVSSVSEALQSLLLVTCDCMLAVSAAAVLPCSLPYELSVQLALPEACA